MKFSLEFDSSGYFVDFLALSLLLLPFVFLVISPYLRRWGYIISGIYLLMFIAPRLALFYVFFWLGVFVLQRCIASTELRSARQPNNPSLPALARLIFWASIVFALLPMISWKIDEWRFVTFLNLSGNDLLGIFNKTLWEIDLARNIVTPIGLSFATFRALDLLIKSYIGTLGVLSLDRVLFYGFFPPVIAVGPIIEYEEIRDRSEASSLPDPEDLMSGGLRAAWGFFKVLFLVSLLQPSSMIFELYADQAVFTIWLYLFVYTWFFYINFSGYSDIAIGLARMHGYKLKENFNNPFFARNIIEFWSGWHMSLYRFARRNVFVPLGGYRAHRHLPALAGTMMTIALWHALSASMFAFGLYHTSGLLIHRAFTQWKEKTGVRLNHPLAQVSCALLTYLFVYMSFPLIVLPFGKALTFYAAMFGVG